jgi:hypothetical protein
MGGSSRPDERRILFLIETPRLMRVWNQPGRYASPHGSGSTRSVLDNVSRSGFSGAACPALAELGLFAEA